MKKIILILMCATNISVSYAAGLFDMINSAVTSVTGSSSSSGSDSSSGGTDANGGINKDKVNVSKSEGGWKIYEYKSEPSNNLTECSRG